MSILQAWVPKTLENRAALRTSIATVVAVLIAFKLHLATPYWSGMTVLIVSNLYTGSILDKAIMRIAGTLVGAWVGYFIASFVVNSFGFYLTTCFLLITISVYYYYISSYSYACLLFGLTAFIVISQLAIAPGNAFFVAIWRSSEIALGVVVSAVCAFCIFPSHVKDSFCQQIHDIFFKMAEEVGLLSELTQPGKRSLSTVDEVHLQLKKALKQATDMMGFMHHEMWLSRGLLERWRLLLDLLYGLMYQMNYFLMLQRTMPADSSLLPIDKVFRAMQTDLTQLGLCCFTTRLPPAVLLTAASLESLDEVFHVHHETLSKEIYYVMRHLLQQMNDHLNKLHACLLGQQKTEELSDDEGIRALFSWISLKKSKPIQTTYSRMQRLQGDADLIKHSIKAGLSVLLAMLIWLLSSWPGGLNGIISSLVISVRRNLYEMKHVAMHRLFGCVLGGGSALCLLALVSMDVYDFIICFLCFIWAFSLFAFCFPNYAYIGLQANIAWVITLAQEGGPPVYLGPPLERLGGIVIGITASFIVANLLWRQDLLSMLSGRLQKLGELLKYNAQQVLTGTGKSVRLHDVSGLFWLCRGLIESSVEEPSSISNPARLDALKQRFEVLVMTQATIRYLHEHIDKQAAQITAYAAGIDLNHYESVINQSIMTKAAPNVLVQQQLEMALANVAKDQDLSLSQRSNLLAYLNALQKLAMAW